jgi:hypothetical protein
MMFRAQLVNLTLLIGLLAGWLAPAREAEGAEPRPFKGRVVATWDNVFNALFAPPATFEGVSWVTHMGLSQQEGWLVLGPPDTNGLAPGYGSVTITAANGDELTFDYEGVLNAATGEGIGTFAFTGGSGRFANASGGGTFYALIDLSQPAYQPMTVVLDGDISY